MDKILFFYIGESNLPKVTPDMKKNNSYYHYYEKKESLVTNDCSKTFFLDYTDMKEMRGLISELSSIGQIFIITKMFDEIEPLDQVKDILEKVLKVLITITYSLMLQKKGKVWLVYYKTNEQKSIALDLARGLKTMIHVFAMEMSKKGIVANFIETNAYEEKLGDIIKWGDNRSNFNFTAQHLKMVE